MQIRESAEDYLESILVLSQKGGGVRSVDIAARLGVSKPSVSHAMGLLRQRGQITMDKDGWIELTDEGRAVAEKRVAANDKTADDILSCLSDEEIAQLNALTEKIILSLKDKGINGKKKGRKAHECCCR